MQVIHDFFSQDQLDQLLALPAIQSAYIKGTQQSFSVEVSPDIQATLNSQLGLNLSTTIPCRLIVGDTSAHSDRGPSDFEYTYLIYLNDAEGDFIIDGRHEAIVANTAFKFAEGLSHEVVDTNGSKRLLLGPMNEFGQAVGTGTVLSEDGATTTIYIGQDITGLYYYKIDTGVPTPKAPFPALPIYINNTTSSPSPDTILKVIFETDITTSAADFSIYPGTSYIQFGSDTLNPDGTRPIITINNVPGYQGLIQNGTNSTDGYSYIYVFNLDIRSAGTTTLATGGGWIGQAYFGRNTTGNRIINCSSSGNITDNSGGILGQYAGLIDGLDPAIENDMRISGCTTSGQISGTNAGGIVGSYAANINGTGIMRFEISYCRSDGQISGNGSGGIAGAYFCKDNNGGISTIDKSYSTGTISGNSSGGICGTFAANNGNPKVIRCYSTGNINGTGSGGIYGSDGGIGTSNNAVAELCYSIGTIGSSSGGIFGSSTGVMTCNRSYTAGNVGATGAIFAGSTTIPSGSAHTDGWDAAVARPILIQDDSQFHEVTVGQPFLLFFGCSPYNLITVYRVDVTGYNLSTYVNYDLVPGMTIGPSILSPVPPHGYTYELINNISPYISIDSTSGLITISPNIPIQNYTLYVYAHYNPYSITAVNLNVTEPEPTTSTATTVCCGTLVGQSNLVYNTINDVQAGNTFSASLSNPKFRFASYTDYLKYQISKAYRR